MSGAVRSIVAFIIFVILLFATLALFMGLDFAIVITIIVVLASIGGIMHEVSRK